MHNSAGGGKVKNEASLLDVIAYLYDATSDMTKCRAFLERLTRFFDGRSAQLLHYDYGAGGQTFSAEYGLKHDEALLTLCAELAMNNPQALCIHEYPEEPRFCRIGPRPNELLDSCPLQDMLRANGAEYVLAVHTPERADAGTTIVITRDSASRAFDESDCDLFKKIVPHIKRAIGLHRQSIITKHRTFEALNYLPIGIVLVDENCQVTFINRTAREFAENNDGLIYCDDVISVSHPEERETIRKVIRKLIHSARRGEVLPSETMVVTRRSGARSYLVLIDTLWDIENKEEGRLMDDPIAVMFITDPEYQVEVPAESLQRLFDLLPFEARLLEKLIGNRSLEEASRELGITKNTARQYLKAVFDKTNTNRQAQLMKLVMSTPVWVHGREKNTSSATSRPEAGIRTHVGPSSAKILVLKRKEVG